VPDISRAALRFDVLDKVPVGVLVLDPDYRILFWNECLENWTGTLRGALLGGDARSHFPNIAKSSFSRRIERVFRDGVPTVFSPQLHSPFIQCEITPGVLRIQYITVTSIPSQSGSGFQAVFSIQDITDLTRRLDESRRTSAELANELRQRAALQNDLCKAKDAADAANRAKSDFLANMSHEIRTPMNGILGMIGLVLDGQLDLCQRRRAEAVRSSADDLLAILNDILDHSKIEAKKLQLETTELDVRALVEAVADLVAVTAQKKGLEVLCFVHPDVPTELRGDPMRLRQVIMNLASNAVKFTAHGEVSIAVELAQPGDPATLRFEVADSGIGIPPDKVDLLFRPFSQADTTTTRRYGGTGLGLSIVARLVELMGGQVGFSSEEGQGSRFWFTARFERPAAATPPLPSLPHLRILVVDDNATSREVLANVLGLWQCGVTLAFDVETALEQLRSAGAAFDVAIVDLQMPGAGGEQFAAELHADAALAGLPLLLMTPLTETSDSGHWRALGFAAHVTKPVKQNELASALASIFDCPAAAAAIRPSPDAVPHSDRASRALLKVLLVEDNQINQMVARGMLKNLGYGADVAADGRTALRALARMDYDLVLMDCQLPDLDGYEATRLIRNPASEVRNHDIPVVAMTANAMAGDREKCLASGMNDYISKPIDSVLLERVMERWTAGIRQVCDVPPETAAPTAPLTSAVEFDQEDLLERLSGNEELAQRIISRFLDGTPGQLAALGEAVSGGDATAVRHGAHAIKGAAANVGGQQIRELASKLEQLGADGDLDPAAGVLRELRMSFARTRAPMEEFCRSVLNG
jgi:signal transduction histidine kinase/CheY-like chemotaxis protein